MPAILSSGAVVVAGRRRVTTLTATAVITRAGRCRITSLSSCLPAIIVRPHLAAGQSGRGHKTAGSGHTKTPFSQVLLRAGLTAAKRQRAVCGAVPLMAPIRHRAIAIATTFLTVRVTEAAARITVSKKALPITISLDLPLWEDGQAKMQGNSNARGDHLIISFNHIKIRQKRETRSHLKYARLAKRIITALIFFLQMGKYLLSNTQ